ncbi:MAG: redoxin family protein [Verrucomicrobia bacterium]|nr:redoxin family protein [Verrucomicrobiota bacterium]
MFNGTPVWSQLVVGVGDPAPEIVAPDQDDVTFTLSDEMGKVVLLHVCTLWCVPCVQSAINEATLVASIDSEIGAENWVLVDALYHNLGFGPSVKGS